MKITRASDYTIRALIYMAQFPMDTIFMCADIAKICCIPDSFLGKILQNLAKSDILISERGKNGGFKLGVKPENISVYDIMVAVNGPLHVNRCLDKNIGCCFDKSCYAHKMWEDVQVILIEKLKQYSLSDISESCPYLQ